MGKNSNLQKILGEGFFKKGRGNFIEIYQSSSERILYNPRVDRVLARYKI